ncbi:hypothetical protein JXJ21_25640 [candidate division KSB1 bacterium]|nr:hypothetical protein [candidate division KSB1 bacterium]
MLKSTGNNYPRDTLEQAEMVLDGWKSHLSKLNVPNVALEEFQSKIDEAKEKVQHAENLREERTRVVKVRNDALMALWDLTKRVRNAAKATFGDDSKEIEKFGGKPSRQRKRSAEF